MDAQSQLALPPAIQQHNLDRTTHHNVGSFSSPIVSGPSVHSSNHSLSEKFKSNNSVKHIHQDILISATTTAITTAEQGQDQFHQKARMRDMAGRSLSQSGNEMTNILDFHALNEKNAASRASNFGDVQSKMNIHHFEQLMKIFNEHRNEDGSNGFTIEKFRDVFGSLFQGHITVEQLNMLYMKIDANSDGNVTWDEFSTYMMSVPIETDAVTDVIDEKTKKLANAPHKDAIITIDYVPKERKFLTVSREGEISIWSPALRVQRSISTKTFNPRQCWIHDAKFMPEQGKLMVVTDDRQLCIYDLFSIKPRVIAVLSQLEHNPLCVSYTANYDDDIDLILFGDDGGYMNVLHVKRRFYVDSSSSDTVNEHLTPAKLMKKDSLERNGISMYRREIHSDWVLKVQYYEDMNAFISCSNETNHTLIVGDLERKTMRSVPVPKGVRCFEFCKRPSFLITGGRDKILRLWNPYVLNKPTATLQGHNAAINKIVINHDDGHIISLSDDRVIKIWNARSLMCLQTILDKGVHRPEHGITSIFFDSVNHQLIAGSNRLETHPLINMQKQAQTTSHEAPVVGAMFNTSFYQVVSACQQGTVTLWDPTCGERIFQFHRAHDDLEITAMCFDKSGRRLVTGSRDGYIKMWNFNNGRILRSFVKPFPVETTDIIHIEMGANKFVIAVGWDKRVMIYLDDPTRQEVSPTRILNGYGGGSQRGHDDDLSAVAFCPPNLLATASIDGSIVIWNLESGHIKATMREPFLDLRSKEEKPVEKILFLYNPERKNIRQFRIPLLTCHADGCLRIWDIQTGQMVNEFNCQIQDDEGLTTMGCDPDCSILIVGGSKGHIRLIDLSILQSNMDDWDAKLALIGLWKAHVKSVVSASYVTAYDMILTASKDMCVRLWDRRGLHIGTFGERSWSLVDPPSNHNLPAELLHDADTEKRQKEIAQMQAHTIKQNVLDSWKDAISVLNDSQKSLKDNTVKTLKMKSLQSKVLQKWKETLEIRKQGENWKITPDLLSVKNETRFFSFDTQTRTKAWRAPISAKHDSVYHSLTVHNVDDVNASAYVHPLKPNLKLKTKGS